MEYVHTSDETNSLSIYGIFFVNCRFVSLFLSILVCYICMSVPHIFCQQNLSVCTCHLKCLSVVDNFDIRLCLSVPDNFADLCTWHFLPAESVCCLYLTIFASCWLSVCLRVSQLSLGSFWLRDLDEGGKHILNYGLVSVFPLVSVMKVPELEEQQGRNIYLSRSEYLSTLYLA